MITKNQIILLDTSLRGSWFLGYKSCKVWHVGGFGLGSKVSSFKEGELTGYATEVTRFTTLLWCRVFAGML